MDIPKLPSSITWSGKHNYHAFVKPARLDVVRGLTHAGSDDLAYTKLGSVAYVPPPASRKSYRRCIATTMET